MAKLTHGEVVFQRRQNIDFSLQISRIQMSISSKIPPRMEYEKAMQYYKNKLNKVWESIK